MKYCKILAYGLLPLLIVSYALNILYVPIVWQEAPNTLSYFYAVECTLYLITAILLAKEKKRG